MSGWLTLFLLISCYCLTCVITKNPCRDFHGATSDVCGLIGENINLTCNLPRNCTRGYWKYDDTINVEWLLSEHYRGDTYLFDFDSSQGVNTLHIENIRGSVAGYYTCFCEFQNGVRTSHACFNFSVLQCPISVEINGEKHDFEKYSVNGAEVVHVKVNEIITVICDDKFKIQTNCSKKGRRFSFPVNPSHHLCSFSCGPKKTCVTSEVCWIILNVMGNTISATTVMPEASISTETTPTTTRNATKAFSPSSTNPFSASEQKPSTQPQKISSAEKFHPGSTSQTVGTQTSRKLTDVGNTNSFLGYTYMPTTATVIFHDGNASLISASWTTQELSIQTEFLHIIVASCVIFVLIIIILILCVHITFYKIGTRSSNDKEEWVNPLYESADIDAQLPGVIPDGGNPCGIANSSRQVANFSSAVSTTNNVHQSNADLGSTDEIPMVQVRSLQNVPV